MSKKSSIETTNVNTEANNVKNKSLVYCTDILKDEESFKLLIGQGPFNIVFVNIVPDVINAMMPLLTQATDKDGYLICSGIIKERENEVIDNMKRNGFSQITSLDLNGWVALTGRK